MPDADTIKMLRDHMENGFLENIVDMFRHDPALWGAVPEMISDERSRVRIGTIALMETLREEQKTEALKTLPLVALKLHHKEPTIRGDVVYLLSVLGLPEAAPFLEAALIEEKNPAVRAEMEETLTELKAP